MSLPKKLPPELGRKSGYVARNRARIIRATLELLGEQGVSTTIEEVAERAEMAPSSIYKHFSTKDELFIISMGTGFSEWQTWANEFANQYQTEIEQLIIPMRLIIRVQQTHPLYAQLISRNPDQVDALKFEVNKKLKAHITKLQKSKILDVPDMDLRFFNLVAVLSSILLKKIQDEKFTTKQAEKAIMIALQMVGLPEEITSPVFTLPIEVR